MQQNHVKEKGTTVIKDIGLLINMQAIMNGKKSHLILSKQHNRTTYILSAQTSEVSPNYKKCT
jgi:hypothetical protein